jgi:hypothetical protein
MSLIASITEDPSERHVFAIKEILERDVEESVMGAMLRDYCNEYLQRDQELFCEVHDKLAKYKIISKVNFRALWNS